MFAAKLSNKWQMIKKYLASNKVEITMPLDTIWNRFMFAEAWNVI